MMPVPQFSSPHLLSMMMIDVSFILAQIALMRDEPRKANAKVSVCHLWNEFRGQVE
jgi:hypothetical protein